LDMTFTGTGFCIASLSTNDTIQILNIETGQSPFTVKDTHNNNCEMSGHAVALANTNYGRDHSNNCEMSGHAVALANTNYGRNRW